MPALIVALCCRCHATPDDGSKDAVDPLALVTAEKLAEQYQRTASTVVGKGGILLGAVAVSAWAILQHQQGAPESSDTLPTVAGLAATNQQLLSGTLVLGATLPAGGAACQLLYDRIMLDKKLNQESDKDGIIAMSPSAQLRWWASQTNTHSL